MTAPFSIDDFKTYVSTVVNVDYLRHLTHQIEKRILEVQGTAAK